MHWRTCTPNKRHQPFSRCSDTAAQNNRGLICIASEITETAINIAGLEAKKAVDEGMEDLLSILSLGLEVMSIDEKSLAL